MAWSIPIKINAKDTAMLNFNSSSLRYKFIYLTKNIYDGIAIHTIFEDALHESGLKMELNEDIPFHLIDKYINFIPFSLRFNVTYKQRDRVLENDITLSAKGEEIKRMSFNHILFFVDMYKPEHTSFLSFEGLQDLNATRERIDAFMVHCDAVISGNRKCRSRSFLFTLREQQIVFHLLQGMSVKEIALELEVSDKLVYRERWALTRKLIDQKNSRLYKRLINTKAT
ncbi:hypothetical protein [Citrobacter amalonaticus]|uniref:hypothetical protein n=1 Tax=Citrobacter amalonaticus TaxID=35703 RepID=UPI0011B0CDC2|nr:hypothetical protein [Citrobacter amalonaticus]HAT6802209.1 hypothetical protein [Citrobacter freundii]EKW2926706.1 hypothetical protein [Citrobacter amalonaticus]MBJ9276882.1 hypothetical protein [Citrobacter amalonaticus]MCR9029072.1 hypothetical protein [Citrobacter amalonaticus]MEC5721963.1 hypothetical protein [Citrobacter amalonaticus]